MTVEQIATLVNTVQKEVIGDEAVQTENLENVVDMGDQVFNARAVDNYVKSLINHIGRVVFVNRPYEGSAPSVLRDAWEYGSVLEKISAATPEATENDSWNLVDGQSYDPNIFTQPSVQAKFFNSKTTFEIPMSYAERQVKESFSGPQQLNAFVGMLDNAIYKSLTVKTDALVMRTINNMTAHTLADAFPTGDYTGVGNSRAINLLALYNAQNPSSTISTASEAIRTPAFVRFAAYTMRLFQERMRKISTLFNVGGLDRFTPESLQHIVLLSDFAAAADIYEQSDTFHDSLTSLPNAERVPYWQGSGLDYSFANTSKIDVKLDADTTVTTSGILGVMFDHDALGVCNWDRRVTTNYNPRGEFYNSWYKQDAMYFNDLNENFVVFFAA